MTRSNAVPVLAVLLSFLFSGFLVTPFQAVKRTRIRPATGWQSKARREDDEEFQVSKTTAAIDASLTRPLINVRKESLLFGQNISTLQDNYALELWRDCKKSLPTVVTGARTPTTADDNPWGAFYNMLLVRVPTIAMCFVYSKNLAEGNPFVVDFGGGPCEMSPLLVFGTFYLILR